MGNLLNLLQLASPVIPIGAYSYSEGLEYLVETGVIDKQQQLQDWLAHELNYGSIVVETAIMLRAYHSITSGELSKLNYWNDWLSASRETAELREQSWQMGTSLLQLLMDLEVFKGKSILENVKSPCNYAIAFGIGAACWNLVTLDAIQAYLHSWVTNLITAGVKIIPLGQTQGQHILQALHVSISINSHKIICLKDEELFTCNWGLSLASMNHQNQYTRLFRS